MGKITTHVLELSSGKPAQGMCVKLYHQGDLLHETVTNEDGRCDAPLIEDPSPGTYELVFSVGDFYRSKGIESPFLDDVPLRFLVEADQSYHVPLLCTPWSYSTYRGS